MATTTSSRHRLPIQSRAFEFSRVHENWMAAAYALVAPAGPSRKPSTSSSAEESLGQSFSGERRLIVRGGQTA